MKIDSEIKEYGGLCGGWSMALLKKKDAFKFWEIFRSLKDKKILDNDNPFEEMEQEDISFIVSFFIDVMMYQYTLDHSDMENYEKDKEDRQAGLAKLKKAIEEVDGSRLILDKEAAKYDINDKTMSWLNLHKIVVNNGGVLIATDTHFMSIKLVGRGTFAVSETNTTGYKEGSWDEIKDILGEEIKENITTINIKYITDVGEKLGNTKRHDKKVKKKIIKEQIKSKKSKK